MIAIIIRSRWYLLLTTSGRSVVSIFIESDSALAHMFNACTTEQINEFIPEKRSLRIHGQSTTLRLERAFWNVLDEIAHDQVGKMLVAKVDTDAAPEVAMRYGIRSIPTLIVFEGGEELERSMGFEPERVRALVNKVVA